MLKQCSKGHLFDDEKNEICPYCSRDYDPVDNLNQTLYASPDPSWFRSQSDEDSTSEDFVPFKQKIVTNRADNRQPDFRSFVEDQVNVLAALKKMLDAGLIMQSDYDKKKAEVLRRL